MTHKTIVALYDDATAAQRVLSDLDTAGLRHDFTVMGGAHARTTAGWSDTTTSTTSTSSYAGSLGSDLGTDYDSPSNRIGTLTRMGVPHDDAQVYCEGVRRGGVLLVGRVDDGRCDEALDIIERHNPVDPDERLSHYRTSGWTGYDATATDYDATQVDEERTRYGTGTGMGTGMGLGAAASAMRDANTTQTQRQSTDTRSSGLGSDHEERIPVVEEAVNVGKRAIEGGHIRVRSYVVEQPVNETVNLRDERVSIERRAVDYPAGEVPPDAFKERTIDVTERREEAVVNKEARVREEVVIRKEVEERAQNVSDTVRRTEVEIDDNRTDRPDSDRPITDRPITDRPITDRDV
ncbi:YsnF/AvaK domain-containing protein [Azospirillum sp.]|uniref:YsnF/AvaK domain-containing protein n=1 Tax=Azospirillum sp. TaxID=34012 RepID=UPI002D2547BC|nr:YsnF/AvaK domain-containing protein [Azospirillum sp.]HYD65115.1 YsnF/AvaK domain-containing protein [Azospirillum sp.]